MATTSATSVQILNEHDKQADENASQSAPDSKISDIDLLLNRWVRCYGAGSLDQRVSPLERVIPQPLPQALYHPTGHLAKPKYWFTNPDYVCIDMTKTETMSKEELEEIEILNKQEAATRKGRARAKRKPAKRIMPWKETRTPPFTRMSQSDPSMMIPDLVVTRPDGKIRYLEDPNHYKKKKTKKNEDAVVQAVIQT